MSLTNLMEFKKEVGYIPVNFWLGTTITDQSTIKRVDELLRLREITSSVTLCD